MKLSTPSRRQFLVASGNLASTAWLAVNWSHVANAAEHAHHAASAPDAAPTRLSTLNAAEAADVEAIADRIIPGGKTPGAKDARVIFFVDSALGSFFGAQLPAFRSGLAEFQQGYVAQKGAASSFAAATPEQQDAWLREVDQTPFFHAVRRLSILGLLALPKYGGNKDYAGWKTINVVDNHAWQPPFGAYDVDYAGFEPYPGTKPYTA